MRQIPRGTVGQPVNDGEVGYLIVKSQKGAVICPYCNDGQGLSFRDMADHKAFKLRIASMAADGGGPAIAVYCYGCERDWEVPPGALLEQHERSKLLSRLRAKCRPHPLD